MPALVAELFDMRSHNGTITLRSFRTGEHRTVRIHTQPRDADFMPGKRLVELLTGPDNTSDFRSFGVLSDDASRVFLWKRHHGSQFFEWVARFLVNPDGMGWQVEYFFEGRCRVCNRPLTTPESIESGIGPVCAEREAFGS